MFMHRYIRPAMGAAVMLALLSAASHRSAAADGGSTPERDAAPVINRVLEAWRRADASAIAAEYESTGDFVSPDGDHAVGRRAIEAFYGAAFTHGYAGSNATAGIVHARYLSGSLALVDGFWTIEPTAAAKITAPEAGVFVAILHRRDGRWWIAALREQSSARGLREFEAGPNE